MITSEHEDLLRAPYRTPHPQDGPGTNKVRWPRLWTYAQLVEVRDRVADAKPARAVHA